MGEHEHGKATPGVTALERPLLDDLLEQAVVPAEHASRGAIAGACVDERHPSLQGRIRVAPLPEGPRFEEQWVATLMGTPVRRGDRVLLLPVAPVGLVVIGVLDGFAKRPESPKTTAAIVELKRDEALTVQAADGTTLVELTQGDQGPRLTVHSDDLEVRAPGRLRLRGKTVQIEAEQGQIDLKATDDVVVRGETIRLN